ncbi:ABC transporter permease [Nibrella saemangeumensis]|uniref:ABC transporter permease n=1 Tax=Nibrella saemangeumensis TaxID=1084526 RepID=A0ABP8MCN4_9BACT
MLRNYLLIAVRNLRKHKGFTFINVFGLALGLACCMLITLYVRDEVSYDNFHLNADRIVLLQQFENIGVSGGKLATDLKARFAQVQNTVRLLNTTPLITFQNTAYYEPKFYFADSTAFDVFSFSMVQGNPRTALAERNGVVISASAARKYFPNQNPLGQTLLYNSKTPLRITGVMQDLPRNAHVTIDFLASYASANDLVGYDVTTNYWGGNTWTYLLLAPGTDPATLLAQFPAYVKSLGDPNSAVWRFNLIPLRDIYLKTELVASDRLLYVYIFSLVALLIIGLACFNYVNLTTARSATRAREVGVRKAMGSSFGQLWQQFLSETTLYVLLAVLVSVGLLQLALPYFNTFTDKQLSLTSLLTREYGLWLLGGIGLLSVLTGSYPALVLSSLRPVLVLKGSLTAIGKKALLRQVLVVGQFTVSVVLIVATVVVYQQLNYIRHKDLGYQREQILTLDLRDAADNQKELFKQQVKALPSVVSATRSFGLPGSGRLRGEKLVSEFVPKGAADGGIVRLTADGDFLNTFGIKLLEGRTLDPNRPADRQAFLVNKAAMKFFGWSDLAGKQTGYYTFQYDPKGGYREVPVRGDVVGVVEDYHHADLKTTVAPMLFSLPDGWEGQMAIKLRAGNVPMAVQQIQTLWTRSFSGKPFEYAFMDDTFNQTYKSEVRTGQVFGLFASLAVLISCLGLFGLAAYTAERRTKEIGIRKVLGASVPSLVSLLSRDFLKLILIAIVIATPVAWYAMNRWLEDFAYRTDIPWWVFLLAGLLTTIIALLTVSYQSIRAALLNPVTSLRSE